MKVICAWCQREGRSGFLREREPLDDASETHGICLRHQRLVVATLPSHSFPDVQLLIVVRPDERALYGYLKKALGELKGVHVIVDRRQGERRRDGEAPPRERRRGERRLPDREVHLLGCTVVRFGSLLPSPEDPVE